MSNYNLGYDFGSKVAFRKNVILQRVAPEHQYWTLCANHVDDDGNLLRDSEFHQLKQQWWIKDSQLHGVDMDGEIIECNKAHLPNFNWYHGDMYEVMAEQHELGLLQPSIVHLDFIWAAERSIEYTRKILSLLRPYKDVTVISNFCQDVYSHRSSSEEINSLLAKELWIELQYWSLHDKCYTYPGRGHGTKMRTYILSRRPHYL